MCILYENWEVFCMKFFKKKDDLDWCSYVQERKINKCIFKLITKSILLKESITTDQDRRDLINLKYKVSSFFFYNLMKEIATSADPERWDVDVDRYYGGDISFTIRDRKKNVSINADYDTADNVQFDDPNLRIKDEEVRVSIRKDFVKTHLESPEKFIMIYFVMEYVSVTENLKNLRRLQNEHELKLSVRDWY